MVVTTPISELMAIARRYEAEDRWAQAEHAYGQILDNMAHPTSTLVQDDRAMIAGLQHEARRRSQLATSTVATVATEEAKHAIDKQGERAYAKRQAALAGNPQT